MTTGRIFDIQRFSIHDGPGIRTTVFLKGCPLRCLWCGNPESIAPEPQLSYLPVKCLACKACYDVCPEGAISILADGKVKVDHAACTDCGRCAEVCDADALEMVGRDMTVDQVLQVVLRDAPYYAQSGGGITLSGGEPLLQGDFCFELLAAAKAEGLDCCVETSGLVEWKDIERLIPIVDLWLYDYKETDPRLHQKFTGFWNSEILAHLRRLHGGGGKIILRCPIIPGHNERKGHFDGIVAIAKELTNLQGVELLAYYDLWRAKLHRFGLTSELPKTVKPPTPEKMEHWNDYLRRHGVTVIVSG